MTIFVRPARADDQEIFTKWYIATETFNRDILNFPDTYTLVAFNQKNIYGFLIVQLGDDCQVLCRFIHNPKSSSLIQSLSCAELVKQVITLGYLKGLNEIYFTGNNLGTNRISERIFHKIEDETKSLPFPIFRLKLEDLECPAQ